MYTLLLRPVESTIPPGSTLMIVPDGNLGYLPFESLVVGSRHSSSGEIQPAYLLDRFAVAYGPSASALAAVQQANSRVQFKQTLGEFELVKKKIAFMAANAFARWN